MAKMVQRAGASAVIAEGGEAGGHVGELLPCLLFSGSMRWIFVIAAGGIADGRGIAAVLMLGASGVQLGTIPGCPNARYIPITRIKSKGERYHTMTTERGLTSGALKTPFTRLKNEKDSTKSIEELEAFEPELRRAAGRR